MMPRGLSTMPYTRTMLGELTPIMIIASFCNAALVLASILFSCFTATSNPCHLARYTVPKVPMPISAPIESVAALLIWHVEREASLSDLKAKRRCLAAASPAWMKASSCCCCRSVCASCTLAELEAACPSSMRW